MADDATPPTPASSARVEDATPTTDPEQTDALLTGKDYKKWLQTRCEEWNTSEGEKKDKWTEVCTKKYRRVPQTKHMSLSEMEESLKGCGDAELEEMKGKAEPLYDGTVDRFIRDNSGQQFAAFIKCKEHFGDQHVYCHKVHINHIQSGDKVRFAVHFNAKKQPQVSFIDRLNDRATNQTQERGGVPYASPVYASAPAGGVLVQLADGTVVSGMPLRVEPMISSYPMMQVPMRFGYKGGKKGKGKGKGGSRGGPDAPMVYPSLYTGGGRGGSRKPRENGKNANADA
jgi:hypothetical protein